MYERLRFTEYLDLDLNDEHWYCHDCGTRLISARESYKKGCLVAEREPNEIHNPVIQGNYTFAPDSDWVRIIEFYCPGCSRQIETEYLPPGHPITVDIEVDIDRLKKRLEHGDLVIRDGRLTKTEGARA
ncbi:acetone carboxylase subunit gamma [Neopusillimonas aromaticivorans]|uniref:acetone carboxylase subunit gamma n=1 Tax=Neopusillimonas aromaticivorans TaxID=2979868 RepID=UPI0025999837|nr:acetone carboxylase subunit gamma [Neopusillimonas aromaticivorans]WJJ93948.1 acetone carboxylase subunit gamma [Neopusillimonas aromaticivorans]